MFLNEKGNLREAEVSSCEANGIASEGRIDAAVSL